MRDGDSVAIKAPDEVGKLLLEFFQVWTVNNMSPDLKPAALVLYFHPCMVQMSWTEKEGDSTE